MPGHLDRRVLQDLEDAIEELDARPGLLGQLAALSAIAGGGRGVFWLSVADAPARTILLLADSSGALKKLQREHASDRRGVRGQLRMSPEGWIEMRTAAPLPELLPAVAAWTRHHLPDNPGLRVLRGLHHIVREKEEAFVETALVNLYARRAAPESP